MIAAAAGAARSVSDNPKAGVKHENPCDEAPLWRYIADADGIAKRAKRCNGPGCSIAPTGSRRGTAGELSEFTLREREGTVQRGDT